VDVACTVEMRHARSILVGKPKLKVPSKRPMRRWVDTIRCILSKSGERVWDRFI